MSYNGEILLRIDKLEHALAENGVGIEMVGESNTEIICFALDWLLANVDDVAFYVDPDGYNNDASEEVKAEREAKENKNEQE